MPQKFEQQVLNRRPQLLRDGNSPWPYWEGSLVWARGGNEGGRFETRDLRHPRVAPHVSRLSRNLLRRSDQIRWLKRGVDPFSGLTILHAVSTVKSQPGKCLLLSHATEYRLWTRQCLPMLKSVLETGRGEVQICALAAIVQIEGSRCEPLLIRALEDPQVRYKFTAIEAISRLGSIKCVPAVSEFVKQAVRRNRGKVGGRETDLSMACRFLLDYIDESDAVEPAFAAVVRNWEKLGHNEARYIHIAVRWIGVRTLEPAATRQAPIGDNQVIRQTVGASPRAFRAFAEQHKATI